MNTIFKYVILSVMLYVSINWVADNPLKVNEARRQLNTAVDAGFEAGSNFAREVLQ